MKKEKILKKLEEELGSEAEKAKKNDHAKRKPRPCGFTVHVAKGCRGGCLYCYVTSKPKLVDLTPKALLYALISNPRFEIGRSFVAIGSICEPLDFPKYTKEFLEEILKLGNPVQISTKEVNHELAKILKRVDALVSMCVAIDDIARKFEPKRPLPSSRLEFCEEINAGVFLRPILPTISLKDYYKSVKIIAEHTDRIILGNLRLTKAVKEKLGIKSLPRKYFEMKEKLENYAKELGLIVYRSACCSNAYKHGVVCWNECWKKNFCSACPNRCWEKV